VQLELKTKHQPLSAGWRQLRPDIEPADLFVLDELSLRKIVDAGRYAFLLVRDVPRADDALVDRRPARRQPSATCTAPRPLGVTKLEGQVAVQPGRSRLHHFEPAAALDELLATTSRLEQQWSDIAPWPPQEETDDHHRPTCSD